MVTEPDLAAMRAAMVESQLRTSDVNDVRVIEAMAHVPRERSEERRVGKECRL